jgi:hypothetical protein
VKGLNPNDKIEDLYIESPPYQPLYSCTRSRVEVRSDRILAEIPSGNNFFEKRAQQHVKVRPL